MHLEVTNLYKQFSIKRGAIVVLKDINMHVKSAELVCVVGVSGSGKSTLLRLIAGLETPTAGNITVDGVKVTGPGSERSMVFQGQTLYPWMTVQKNVEFGLKLQGVSKKQRKEQASYYLELVGLSEFALAYPSQLSGGMKQRVEIARSLCCDPKVLLMDEPFGALDVLTKENMQQLLIQLWQRINCTILMITHDIEEAVFLSKRIYILTPRPGTIRGEFEIDLPEEKDYKIKRHPCFYHYTDEIKNLLRGTSSAKNLLL